MNVSLTPAQEKYIAAKVKSGQYQTASEFVREALRMYVKSEADDRRRLRDMRTAVMEGIRDLDAGRSVDGELAMASLRKRLESRRRKIA